MKIRYSIISETGPRSKNEDSVKVMDNPSENQWLGIVCDGLGGHSMGDVASNTVCEAVYEYYARFNGGDAAVRAYRACRAAAAKLDERAFALNHVQMGTTLAMANIEDNMVTIAHCGDSRCYLMRNGQLIHQTRDHISQSFGWEVVSNCFFSYKNGNIKPDIAQFEVMPGDRILLCSDGLYKSIPPEILEARMWDDKSPEELLDVYAFLCEKNADDNYTGILAIIE